MNSLNSGRGLCIAVTSTAVCVCLCGLLNARLFICTVKRARAHRGTTARPYWTSQPLTHTRAPMMVWCECIRVGGDAFKIINLNWMCLCLCNKRYSTVCVSLSPQSTAIYSWTDEFAVKTTWKSCFFCRVSLFLYFNFSNDAYCSGGSGSHTLMHVRKIGAKILNARRMTTTTTTTPLWWINIYWIDDFRKK